MQQWFNDALLMVSSALFLDQMVDYVNQTRLFATDGVLIKRKPSLANRLSLTRDEDALADEVVLMTKQTYISRHAAPILRDRQFNLLKGRLRKAKNREDVALMRTRAWREHREFLYREQDALDKKYQEHQRSIEHRANHCDSHLKCLKQALGAAQKNKDDVVAEVALLRKESRNLKETLKAMRAPTSRGKQSLKLLKRAMSEEALRKKAQMENTDRRLAAIKASHRRFMMHQIRARPTRNSGPRLLNCTLGPSRSG